MLVLSRKVGERIRIGDDIELVVLEISRDQVRLGVQAPRDVTVHREEVYREIVAANLAAAVPDVADVPLVGAVVARAPGPPARSAVNTPSSPVTNRPTR